jgi:hypothetical protein
MFVISRGRAEKWKAEAFHIIERRTSRGCEAGERDRIYL